MICFLLLLPEPDGGERILRDLVRDLLAGLSLLPIYVDQPFQHLGSPALSSVNTYIHQSLVVTTHNGQIIKHKSLIFLL